MDYLTFTETLRHVGTSPRSLLQWYGICVHFLCPKINRAYVFVHLQGSQMFLLLLEQELPPVERRAKEMCEERD